jgi:hypothetical protein
MAGQMDSEIRAPLKIHFGVQANLFDSGRRQEKAALATAKADFPSLPESKNLLLAAQKQFFRATHKRNDVFTRIRIRGFVFFQTHEHRMPEGRKILSASENCGFKSFEGEIIGLFGC